MATGQRSEIIVAADAQALAMMAAHRLLDRIRQAREQASVCLTGGSTPRRLYRLLASERYRGHLPWDRVHWFIGDERFVPADDSLSNIGMARRTLLTPAAVNDCNIHPIMTAMASPESAARRYETELKRFYKADRLDPARPLFDLVLMGLGIDGHTASLFPGSPALNENERWAVGVESPGLEPFVPRVTLTFPVLASTREMLFMVSGRDKREILARVLSGEDLPANRAHAQGKLAWLVDRAAASENHCATSLADG